MKNYSFKLVLWGSLFVIILGSLLHFVFEWSGYSVIIASFAAVNESTWEHIKLGFWPLIIWSLIEYFLFKVRSKNFLFAKSVTVVIYCILIPTLFYLYTTVLGSHNLFIDIFIFVISIIIGQYLGYKVLKIEKDMSLENVGASVVVVLIFSFVFFTFFPLEKTLFEDPVSGGYGIADSH